MVKKARKMMQQKLAQEPVGFRLLPSLFTLTQLQKLYEAVKGETIDKRNFRKRIKEMDFIEKTELIDKSSSKRGASLYRFNKRIYNEDPNFKLGVMYPVSTARTDWLSSNPQVLIMT